MAYINSEVVYAGKRIICAVQDETEFVLEIVSGGKEGYTIEAFVVSPGANAYGIVEKIKAFTLQYTKRKTLNFFGKEHEDADAYTLVNLFTGFLFKKFK